MLNLTNATSEIVMRPVTADQAPNLDVYVSVVQSVAANARHLAARAHGLPALRSYACNMRTKRHLRGGIGFPHSSLRRNLAVDGGNRESLLTDGLLRPLIRFRGERGAHRRKRATCQGDYQGAQQRTWLVYAFGRTHIKHLNYLLPQGAVSAMKQFAVPVHT